MFCMGMALLSIPIPLRIYAWFRLKLSGLDLNLELVPELGMLILFSFRCFAYVYEPGASSVETFKSSFLLFPPLMP